MTRPNDIFQSSSVPELNVEVEVDKFGLAALMPLVSRQLESSLTLPIVVVQRRNYEHRSTSRNAKTALKPSAVLTTFLQFVTDSISTSEPGSMLPKRPPPQQPLQMLLSMRSFCSRMYRSNGVSPDDCGTPGRTTVSPVDVR